MVLERRRSQVVRSGFTAKRRERHVHKPPDQPSVVVNLASMSSHYGILSLEPTTQLATRVAKAGCLGQRQNKHAFPSHKDLRTPSFQKIHFITTLDSAAEDGLEGLGLVVSQNGKIKVSTNCSVNSVILLATLMCSTRGSFQPFGARRRRKMDQAGQPAGV